MRKILLFCCLIFTTSIFVQNAEAQNTDPVKPEPQAAKPADVSSIDAIIKALYEVISGGIGQKRDWNRFRSLLHKDARLSATYKSKKTGKFGLYIGTIEQYIAASSPIMEKEGFFEKEIAQRREIFGNVAHVFSTYQSFYKADDKTPFERGINSFQLYNDGTRWWILNILWQDETEDFKIPQKYLKNE